MKYKIEKLDNKGRGICYVDNKITFVNNALPNEEVSINIIKSTSKYNEANVLKYYTLSPNRLESPCPYFNKCGGCNLLHMSYENTLLFKKDKLTSILHKYANLNKEITIIPSTNHLNYRNKITLKVKDGIYGYYEPNSHKIISITNCCLAELSIYNFIKDLKYLHIQNGEIIIRSNYNNELLIAINTKEHIDPEIAILKNRHKIVGIICNDKILIGSNKFVEIINHHIFQVSYDSFFQINRDICSKIFDFVLKEITPNEIILDLYCGVGTLGIISSKNAKKVFGIEIVKNAVLNAITNAKINKRDNIYYMLGDVSLCLPKIKDKVNTIIVDPPRAGLDSKTKETIINLKPTKIIYVSCDPMTLARDLKELQEYYEIKTITGFDMFPYTEHVECVSLLSLKNIEK